LTIRLNGEPFEIAGPVTISTLLADLKIDPRIVAVEHNVVVVKKHHYETTLIAEGDEIEIVRFVGGG
jgi:thiamine biosynthesis protein ThiS